MSEEPVSRRLAAIMAIDAVGYSRLMGADETGTHKRLTDCIESIVKPAITAHKGRIVKLTGDGLLAEFPSAVEGVRVAVDIQKAMTSREPGISDDQKITFRIGVNLGDIIIEKDDIYGDGVNIAARIEGLADPGSVFISRAVADQIEGKIDVALKDLGAHTLKNISKPVHIFCVQLGGDNPASATLSAPSPLLMAHKGLIVALAAAAIMVAVSIYALIPSWDRPADKSTQVAVVKPTIAVLPFANFSDDKAQEYFSDGLTEDLITDISKISDLSVIARNSTFSYKGKTPDVREVGTDLGATHVIEGSVRKSGNTVRITVQLIDAADGTHLWADRYDRELKDIFAIQDEVIGQIISVLSIRLTPEEEKRVALRGTNNPKAHDLYLHGRERESFFNKAAYAEAEDFYRQAIALDPDYAAPYARLSIVYQISAQFGWANDPLAMYEKSLEAAEKAVALSPSLPVARFALGRILARPYFARYELAIEQFKKSIAMEPSYADSHANLALVSIFTGNAAHAAEHLKTAIRINPLAPFWYYFARGMAHYLQGDYTQALTEFETATERNPTVFVIRYWLAATLAQLGEIENAEWQVEEWRSMGYDMTLDEMLRENPITHPPYREKLIEGLQKAGFE